MSEPLPFFVMLNHPSCPGNYTPLGRGGENEFELASFTTKEQAEAAAKTSVLGEALGYEVFQIGYGVSRPCSRGCVARPLATFCYTLSVLEI